MKIVFLANGKSVHTKRWLEEMVRRNFTVFLITDRLPEKPIENVTTIPITRKFGMLGWFLSAGKVRETVKKIAPDIVHAHYVTSYGLWAAACGFHPMVFTAWGTDILVTPNKNWVLKTITKWLLSKPDLITADAIEVVERIRHLSSGKDVRQLQWGVNIEDFKPAHDTNNDGVYYLTSLRNWEKNYNIDIILKAFSLLVNTPGIPLSNLLLLGEGSEEKRLKELSDSLGIGDKVKFFGHVDQTELINILNRSTVSVSVPTNDATSMSVLESMAACLPLIVTDIAANRQWINEDGGIFVSPGDIEELYNAMKIIIMMKDSQRYSLGERNFNVVSEKASRKSEMDRMAVIYHELVI